MGLLKNLAAMAIRKKVVSALEANCPPSLRDALTTLLADNAAVTAIQNFVMANLKTPAAITPDALKGLEVPSAIRELFEATPRLLIYLSKVAKAGAPK